MVAYQVTLYKEMLSLNDIHLLSGVVRGNLWWKEINNDFDHKDKFVAIDGFKLPYILTSIHLGN